MSLNINVIIRDDSLLVRLKGSLEESTTKELRLRVSEIIERFQITNIILNMEDVTYIDDSGIGFILGRYNQVKRNRGIIIVCNMNDYVKAIAKASGFLKICLEKETEEDALSFLKVL